MAAYTLTARQTPRNNWKWVIIGLPGEEGYPTVKVPDTTLWLVGMHHSCDTVQNIMDAVYSALYDETQVNGAIKAGDTFESAACEVAKYHSYDNKVMIAIPAMRFRLDGFHLVRE